MLSSRTPAERANPDRLGNTRVLCAHRRRAPWRKAQILYWPGVRGAGGTRQGSGTREDGRPVSGLALGEPVPVARATLRTAAGRKERSTLAGEGVSRPYRNERPASCLSPTLSQEPADPDRVNTRKSWGCVRSDARWTDRRYRKVGCRCRSPKGIERVATARSHRPGCHTPGNPAGAIPCRELHAL